MVRVFLFLVGVMLSVSACRSNDTDEISKEEYDSVYERFINNVSIRERAPYTIVYEYRDVRIDELAVLAARYCQETYNMPAHLKSIRLHRNNSRLATFHCNNLQE